MHAWPAALCREHTIEPYRGTVHGAFYSGQRAAREVLTSVSTAPKKDKRAKAAPSKKAASKKKKATPHATKKKKAAPKTKVLPHKAAAPKVKTIRRVAPKYRMPSVDAAATEAVTNAMNEVNPKIAGEDKMFQLSPPQPYHASQIEKMTDDDKGPPGMFPNTHNGAIADAAGSMEAASPDSMRAYLQDEVGNPDTDLP